MLVTTQDNLKRTLEISIYTINFGRKIISFKLPDTGLNHADTHHQKGIALHYGLEIIIAFHGYLGQHM